MTANHFTNRWELAKANARAERAHQERQAMMRQMLRELDAKKTVQSKTGNR